MTLSRFSKMEKFRSINNTTGNKKKTGNKDVLVRRIRMHMGHHYCLNYKEKNYKEKLILETGLVSLPDPVTLQDGWYSVPPKIYLTLFMMMLLTIF